MPSESTSPSVCSDHGRQNVSVLGLKCRALAIDLLGYGYTDKQFQGKSPGLSPGSSTGSPHKSRPAHHILGLETSCPNDHALFCYLMCTSHFLCPREASEATACHGWPGKPIEQITPNNI